MCGIFKNEIMIQSRTYFFFVFMFMGYASVLSSSLKQEIRLTKDQCNALMIDAWPDEGVIYQANVDGDGNTVESADIGGGMTIEIPKTIEVPIQLDVGKYIAPSVQKTSADLSVLAKRQQVLQAGTQNLGESLSSVKTQVEKTQDALKTISNSLNIPTLTGNQQIETMNSFSQSMDALKQQITLLNNMPEHIQSVVDTAIQQKDLLKENFTATQNNPFVQDNIVNLQQNGIQFVGAAQNSLLQTQSALNVIQNTLKEVSTLVKDKGSKFDGDTLKSIKATLEGVEKNAQQAQEKITKVAPVQNQKITALTEDLSKLGVQPDQNVFTNKSELGKVIFHQDGRIYYNGQPLFSEDHFKIKQACQKILKH